MEIATDLTTENQKEKQNSWKMESKLTGIKGNQWSQNSWKSM
jgi:hypothetical protein